MKKLTDKLRGAGKLGKPQFDRDRFKDRLKRGFILLIVGVFLVGGIGIYLLVLFDGQNQSVGADDPQQAINQQLADQLRQKENTVDPAFVVSEPIGELKVIDINEGTGAAAQAGSTVKVNYKGALAVNGKVFDQSSEPIELSLNQVIAGWKEGIPGMKVGGKRKLLIPAAKGYGEAGAGDSIPPNSDLVFEVELVEVK